MPLSVYPKGIGLLESILSREKIVSVDVLGKDVQVHAGANSENGFLTIGDHSIATRMAYLGNKTIAIESIASVETINDLGFPSMILLDLSSKSATHFVADQKGSIFHTTGKLKAYQAPKEAIDPQDIQTTDHVDIAKIANGDWALEMRSGSYRWVVMRLPDGRDGAQSLPMIPVNLVIIPILMHELPPLPGDLFLSTQRHHAPLVIWREKRGYQIVFSSPKMVRGLSPMIKKATL